MESVFTQIIEGKLPGRFVWKDEDAVAFMTVNPIRPGHTLVVPRLEVDHWIELDPPLAQHLMGVSQAVGQAIQQAFQPMKVGQAIIGLEVPHVHIHLLPIQKISDLDFSKADPNPGPKDLDHAAASIRAALVSLNYSQVAE